MSSGYKYPELSNGMPTNPGIRGKRIRALPPRDEALAICVALLRGATGDGKYFQGLVAEGCGSEPLLRQFKFGGIERGPGATTT
jgi:hypothetical protein